MKTKTLIYTILLLIVLQVNSQNKKIFKDLNVGAGFTNTLIHGDLTSVNNTNKSALNIGFYIYVDKMITSTIGFEIKGQSLKLKGYSQELSSSYPVDFINYNTGELYFEGNAFGGEANLIVNLNGFSDNPYKKGKRKFGVASYFGVGYHSYNSKLYSNAKTTLYTPDDKVNKSAIYFTTGVGLRYRFNKLLDFEFRQNINFNTKDDLDAAITKKQQIEAFYTSQLGVIIKLNNKNHENLVWQEKGSVNLNMKDTDKDGVIDKFDIENDTPFGAKVYANGVAVDSDEDGIIDFYDKCRLKIGVKENNGCPVDKTKDTDGDSVPDYVDKELNTPKGSKIDINGVALDSDHDGIIDLFDKCPQIKGIKELDGCPKDTDKDGVYDINDLCPNIAGTRENKGCPNSLSESENLELLRLASNLYFESGKSFLRDSSKRELEKVSSIMKTNPSLKFVIEGHTDSGGKEDYNLKLSQDRADSVKRYLIQLGIHSERLKSIGYGFSKPKYTNKSTDGRQLNRRVEINVDDNSIKELIEKNTHLVLKTDTIFSIAEKYQITVDQIKSWNNLLSNEINVGERLIINDK